MKMYVLIPILLLLLVLCGCAWKTKVSDGDGAERKFTYKHISQDEAKQMMEEDDGHVIVDVRREDEYTAGHIPGAILIPNERIGSDKPQELPDLNQIILVYCRSGNRSRQASQKLADMGYENVYEFGGIMDWTGEIVKTATLSFQSFDGGGPVFEVILQDQEIVSYESKVYYAKADHERMTGAGYTVSYVFTGKKAGETSMTIQERSPIAENLDHKYSVSVDENLNVTIKEISVRDIFEEEEETGGQEEIGAQEETGGQDMHLWVGDNEVPVSWEANGAVEALKGLCPLTISMSRYGGFEQVGAVGQSIPRADEQITTESGDIMLYSGNQIVIFYGSNSWAYTRLGHVELTREELEELLGNDDVTITIE